MTRSDETTGAKLRQENTVDHAARNKGTVRGWAERFKAFKKRNQVSKTEFWTGKLNVVATAPPPSLTNSVVSEHHEDVYDATTGFNSHRPSVHLLAYDSGEDSRRSASWVGSLFTATSESIVSRVTARMRVKQGTDFSFRVAIADWPVLELGLPHSKRVQFERPCQSQAQLQPLYVSEPMLLRPSGRAGGFRDVECVLPNVGSTDAVSVRRDQTLLFAIIPCLTNDLGYEDPGKTRAEAEVACIAGAATGPLLQGLIWSSIPSSTNARNEDISAEPTGEREEPTLLATEELETDERGRAMALKVHFIPVRDGVDGEVGWGHNFVASAHPELLPLLLDRNAPSVKPRTQKRREKEVGSFSDILTNGVYDAAQLRETLPNRCRDRDWELLYSTRRHGVAMRTLLQRVTGRRDTVLLVRDKGGGVFGAFLPAEWKHKANDFYGTGECFVFQLCPSLAKYTWTGANSMFISSNMSGVVIGGGGKAAIWLDSEFNNGGSGPCSTFDSPCLGSSDLFTCLHLEVWAVGGELELDANRDELMAQSLEWTFYLHAFHKAYRSPHLKLHPPDSAPQPAQDQQAADEQLCEEKEMRVSEEQGRPRPIEISGSMTARVVAVETAQYPSGSERCVASALAALEEGESEHGPSEHGPAPEKEVGDVEKPDRCCDETALRAAALSVEATLDGRDGESADREEAEVPKTGCFCFVKRRDSRGKGPRKK